MADASKLKRGGLGPPPLPDDARTDLVAPAVGAATDQPGHPGRLDGRSMRRSGRTVQFATRVSPEFDDRIRRIALREGMLLVEVLEHALDAYESSSKKAAS